ncbi:MAG: stage II sporulation protein M [Thermoanaerobaculia bacterium]|nr:hypothetical protein [Thermoanaerobaculia bacterium]MCK6681792.1 stage II sporulation protein M [Thermoanaerobaculia bacterium]
MNRELFEARYAALWDQLEALLSDARDRSRFRGAKGQLPEEARARLPELHRAVCHHLALVRQRRYGPDLEERLNGLALRAHDLLYSRRRIPLKEAIEFVALGFPRRVREERLLVWLAIAVLVLPAFSMWAAGLADPDLVATIVPAEVAGSLAESFGPQAQRLRPARSDFAMFGFYVRNNAGIAFRTFASGLFFGAGALFFLAYNGLFFGAVAAEISSLGYEEGFYSFVIGHGSFEITGIILAGAAGLRLGLSLLLPGELSRAEALRVAARRSLPLVGGATVYIVIAAVIEAFWSASAIVAPSIKLAVGTALWLAVAAHLLLGGRSRAA